MRAVLPWRRVRSPASARLDQPSVLAHLREVDVFKGLNEADIHALFEMVEVRECAPGTVFFTPDEPDERLYILKSGKVEQYRLTQDGRRLVTRRIGPGTVFGEMSLLGRGPCGAFAEVVEPTVVCVATREDVLHFIARRPDVALRLLDTMGQRLRTLEEQLEQTAFGHVRQRLARFLVLNASPGSGDVVGYTHEAIGDTIGALRQTVTQTLSEMAAQGIVRVGHRRVHVRDLERLRQAAEGLE